ncbi:hypothetical protein LYNGBM3L_19980 [Moorena producens 3L]|uniref:Uncharacterized protein n=1 Tax=Moorena producens 3L TaxID=489825 RepID=F4XMI3_9CYAN|nr:hypothetical protein LYNGBM3L_19980 [Moorena producens 3L]OLT69031.1 hypothetical protein BI334_32070 [Moorena producens 3L]
MISLVKGLNVRGIEVDISTFYKASKVSNPMVFYNLFVDLIKSINKSQKIGKAKLALFPRLFNNSDRNHASCYGAKVFIKSNY